MNISKLRNTLATMILALMALAMLPACSTTEEEPPPEETGTTKDEICDEADAGATGCPELR